MNDFATTTLIQKLTVAAGVFAPGHLGELTQYLPFELVDDVLEQTRTTQQRVRELPSRVGVYFVLALGLFPGLGYARVWAKLTAGLVGMEVTRPSEKALRDLRRRLGPAPMKALFEVVAGPLAQPSTPGVCFAGLRTVAFDGLNSLKVPDTERNRSWIGRIRSRLGWAGYPTLRIMTLAETGTRGLLGATIGDVAHRDEIALARRLVGLLRPGMLVLLDRAFDAVSFLTEIADSGAMFVVRSRTTRNPPVLQHFPDGSYLSRFDDLSVRIIDADLTMNGADGSQVRDRYRLITTLLDHERYPAGVVVRLYHERWEIESAYLALRHTLLGGLVLRSGDRPGVEQETWALLTLYQLLRIAMVEAIESRPGLDPDRASFTIALQTAREELTAARGVCIPNLTNRLGAIGRTVMAGLLPARRPRYSERKVKCATSRYLHRDETRPGSSTAITAIDIAIHTPRINLRDWRSRQRIKEERGPQPPTRRERVTAIMKNCARASLGRHRTRPAARRQAPQHAHPTRRMGPPRLLQTHRRRNIRPARHAAIDPWQPRNPANYAALWRAGLRPSLTGPAGPTKSFSPGGGKKRLSTRGPPPRRSPARSTHTMSHFDISRVALTIAGPQAYQIDAHVYTEKKIIREKLAVQLGPLLIYCNNLQAVASLLDCCTRAHHYGTDILPASAAVRGAPTGNLLNHIGVVLRINQPPKTDDQVVTGVIAKASRTGHPHVRTHYGQLVIDAYDQTATRSWAQAWDTAHTAAMRLWPHAAPLGTDHAAEQFDRDYIARTGALPPPR